MTEPHGPKVGHFSAVSFPVWYAPIIPSTQGGSGTVRNANCLVALILSTKAYAVEDDPKQLQITPPLVCLSTT